MSQTTTSDPNQSTQSTQTGQSQSGQAGSTQSGQSGQSATTQQGTTQRRGQSNQFGPDYPNQPGGYQSQSRSDQNRQGREDLQGTHDAVGQPRDDMRRGTRDQGRDALRGTREDESDERSSASRDEFGTQRQRGFDRDASRDQSQRGSSRDFDRDDFRNQQGQRDYDRDDFRNQQGQQGRRDFSREAERDQYGSQSRQGQRDFSRDSDRDQFSDRRQSGRDERDFQGGRFDQRSGQDQSSGRTTAGHAQITRGADVGLWFDRSHRNALVISDIASSGPITRFGFREGDQIMSVNGQRVSTEQQFINTLVSPQFANQRMQVIVWRNGQQNAIWVEPWVLTQNVRGAGYEQQADQLEQYGIVLDDRYQAPVVWKVTPRSPAYYAGLRGNDVIVAWNNQHVNDPEELENAVERTDRSEIPVQISRNRQLRNLTLEAEGPRTALRPQYDQSYDESTTQQDGYGQQTFQQGYAQPQGYQQGYTQPMYQQGRTQQGTYVQPQQGTYQQQGTQQNRPGILPRLRNALTP